MSDEECKTEGHEDAVAMPVDGVLDLHTFAPKEVLSVTEEYLRECLAAGILEVRIIHGKGKGLQRRAIGKLLARLDFVRHFSVADEGGGGWGATVVTLEERVSFK